MSFDTSGEVEIEINYTNVSNEMKRKEEKKTHTFNTQHIRSIEVIAELFTEKGNDQSPIAN